MMSRGFSDEGDVVKMRTPAGEQEIEIVKVDYV
jgi:transcription elongation GreA/GreB family factor